MRLTVAGNGSSTGAWRRVDKFIGLRGLITGGDVFPLPALGGVGFLSLEAGLFLLPVIQQCAVIRLCFVLIDNVSWSWRHFLTEVFPAAQS